MNQYFLKKDCKELHAFPHVIEFAIKKISTIEFDSLKREPSEFLRFYYVIDGRFCWMVEEQHYMLYPGDLAVILPGQRFGGEKDLFDIGSVSWMEIELPLQDQNEKTALGHWSRLTDSEHRTIERILLLNNSPVLSKLK